MSSRYAKGNDRLCAHISNYFMARKTDVRNLKLCNILPLHI